MLVFDIETNGLYNDVSRIHCMVIYDTVTQEFFEYTEATAEDGVLKLMTADILCGHNIIGYDLPVLRKLFPNFKYDGEVFDTMVVSKIVFFNLSNTDWARHHKDGFPIDLIGKHSLEAYGRRIGVTKDVEFSDDEDFDWSTVEYSEDMMKYCRQDVVVTHELFKRIQQRRYIPESKELKYTFAINLEHKVAKIIAAQCCAGWQYDQAKANTIIPEIELSILKTRAMLRDLGFTDKTIVTTTIAKRPNKNKGILKGDTITKTKYLELNANSSKDIVKYLEDKYSWKAFKLTEKGNPSVDEEVLSALPYDEAKLFLDYKVFTKILSFLKSGKSSWNKFIRNGRIHGSINPMGANTYRMTHSKPNIAQVPAVRKGKDDQILRGREGKFGYEMRELFTVRPGYKLIGADASGLELRILSHYLYRYDQGLYARAVISGTKEEGTDVHTLNKNAAGLSTRDIAKKFVYALLYGCGDEMLGAFVGGDKAAGKKLRTKFLKQTPALAELSKAVIDKIDSGEFLTAIDGRKLSHRSKHSALNLIFQSAGAIVMKVALVILYESLIDAGLKWWEDFCFVGNIHDEFQIEVHESKVKLVEELTSRCFNEAGKLLKLKVQIDGEVKVGNNWAETH